MSLTLQTLFNEALMLSPEDRANLAEKLLESLAQEDNNDLSPAWAAEIRRRLDTFHRGEMKTIPADEVLRSLRSGKNR